MLSSLISYWHLSLSQDYARTQTNMTKISSVVMSIYISVVRVYFGLVLQGGLTDKLGSEIESSFSDELVFVNCSLVMVLLLLELV